MCQHLSVSEEDLHWSSIFYSFVASVYKSGLVRTLVNRTLKINNDWVGFFQGRQESSITLVRNLLPSHLVENVVK